MHKLVLTIIIPTFNRVDFITKNVVGLTGFIRELKAEKYVSIIISDNCSTDNTFQSLTLFKEQNQDIQIQIFKQDKNIGLEQNALFVLQEAKSEFAMFLGDDDFISKEYLALCLEKLKNTDICCILSDHKAILPTGEDYRMDPAIKKESQYYDKGFTNCYNNAWRGHQLSGIVFKLEATLESYIKQNVQNIYPFIYFVAFNCLRGATFYTGEYPIKVTVIDQSKKDWGYSKDGLLLEIFDNYAKLKLPYLKRVVLQKKHMVQENWRFMHFLFSKQFKMYITSGMAIFTSKKTLGLTKLLFLGYFSFRTIIGLGSNIKNTIFNTK